MEKPSEKIAADPRLVRLRSLLRSIDYSKLNSEQKQALCRVLATALIQYYKNTGVWESAKLGGKMIGKSLFAYFFPTLSIIKEAAKYSGDLYSHLSNRDAVGLGYVIGQILADAVGVGEGLEIFEFLVTNNDIDIAALLMRLEDFKFAIGKQD